MPCSGLSQIAALAALGAVPRTMLGRITCSFLAQEVVQELCKHVSKPLIFPLSNPTSQCEISAEDAYKFSKGQCVFAAGMPLPELPLSQTVAKMPTVSSYRLCSAEPAPVLGAGFDPAEQQMV